MKNTNNIKQIKTKDLKLLVEIEKKQKAQLKKQLAEKDKEIELLKLDYDLVAKQYIKLMTMYNFVIEQYNQDKISFAENQIMQIKEKIDLSEKIGIGLTLDGMYEIDNIFANQIKQLKEGKKR